MKDLIIVRGGGDLATGTIYKLKKSGFPILILEVAAPSAIRRNVAFCEVIFMWMNSKRLVFLRFSLQDNKNDDQITK